MGVGLLGAAALLMSCTMQAAGYSSQHRVAAARPRSSPTASTTRPPSTQAPPPKTTTALPPPTTTTTAPAEPGWTPVATTATGVAVDEQTYTAPDGAQVTLVRFRAGQVHFALHPGSTDPPGAASLPGVPSPSITPQEQPLLLAAFNGGFQQGAGPQGFEVNGQVAEPLQAGLASLVIYADGTAQLGVWGQAVPRAGTQVVSVRQNLPPLVQAGQPSSDIANVGDWGATLGGVNDIARSALGEDANGNLIYAGSMGALPSDMASALIQAGATTAMELDINPYWVQLAVASSPGGPLSAGVPGQQRPADQYQAGWTRDFITVLYAH